MSIPDKDAFAYASIFAKYQFLIRSLKRLNIRRVNDLIKVLEGVPDEP